MSIRTLPQHKALSLPKGLTQILVKYLLKQSHITSKKASLQRGAEKQRDRLTLLNNTNSQDLENKGEKKMDSCT